MADSKNLKSTLNLPKTEFAMKANLPQNEPARLKGWDEAGLYGRFARRARALRSTFCMTGRRTRTGRSTWAMR